MKIVFRLNFHTVSGQSMVLKLSTLMVDSGSRLNQVVPMRWLNERQWGAEIEIEGSGRIELEYSYQLRKEPYGVELDEWNGPRRSHADGKTTGALVLIDSWCSAGTVDYALETQAFDADFAATRPMEELPPETGSDHTFHLHMAGVPAGLIPCLIGSVRELGNWGWHHAVPLRQTAPNQWSARVSLPADWHIAYKYGLFNPRLGCAVELELGENRLLAPHQAAPQQSTIIRDEAYSRNPASLYRAAGVAIPVFSLRSPQGLGVGEFADLKGLADWAAGLGLKLIQILPINDTTSSHDWTDSYPYSAISVFALHPIYLRIDDLHWPMPKSFQEELRRTREALNHLAQVDYEQVMQAKGKLTRAIFQKHRQAILRDPGFLAFLEENRDWVLPYAVFCLKRDEFGTADFRQWGEWAEFSAGKIEALTTSDSPAWPEIAYHVWLQSELDRQLGAAVDHLHQRGIALKGDLPIGIDRQSVDAWSAPHLFKMDSQAGAPPDAFAVKGQNWGFPTYDWEVMRRDGYAWWRARFAKLSRYFDAYRIDHILGFFRIWQIPCNQVEGIMGYFDPAMPIELEEFATRGIAFDYNRFCRPYIREHSLAERFGATEAEARANYLYDCGHGYFQLRDHVSDQRCIASHFATWVCHDPDVRVRMETLRDALMDCASEVLFFEVPGSQATQFHPRCSLQATRSFQELDSDLKWRIDDLYVDYFYRRQEGFWEARGYEKLPVMRRASRMLLCGEDLGMVPDCVPGVLRELGILSLEIQRMPKASHVDFSNPADAPYLSVVSPSTHDMPTLRGWWREAPQLTADFAWQMFGMAFPPLEMTGEIARNLILQHLRSPAMWAVFPLQDLLAIDETLRNPDVDAERINVPAIMPFKWQYRMHLPLEELAAADGFNSKLRHLLEATGRARRAAGA
jgi:4-alpha-glucanotransferase